MLSANSSVSAAETKLAHLTESPSKCVIGALTTELAIEFFKRPFLCFAAFIEVLILDAVYQDFGASVAACNLTRQEATKIKKTTREACDAYLSWSQTQY